MIEITEFKSIDKGSLKSQVSIKVPKWGGFIIKRINVFENNEKRWFSFPSQEFEKDGKKMYFKYNDFDTPEMNDAFRVQFFKAYDEYKNKNHFSVKNEF
jgi:DNA-binding cell septation regulator SpoVG